MNGVFATAQMFIVSGNSLRTASKGLIDKEMFIADYGKGDELSTHTLESLGRGSRSLELKHFGIGTMTLGKKSVNSVSGAVSVLVKVSGTIYSYEHPVFAREAGSVGPISVNGIGKDEEEAQVNGLVIAADRAAKDIVNQLRNLGY